MAVYSTFGFLGAFLGPLVFGIALDVAGSANLIGWVLAFAAMGAGVAIGPLAFLLLRARPVEARGSKAA